MTWLSKLLGTSEEAANGPTPEAAARSPLSLVHYREAMPVARDQADAADPLVAVPIPPLLSLLEHQELLKGAPLSEEEVLAIRDGALCMVLHRSRARHLADRRGFADIDPERPWQAWTQIRRDSGQQL
jgi:hypothetical protein